MHFPTNKITLIGNLILDTVFEVDQCTLGGSNIYDNTYENPGGVLNLIQALKFIDQDFNSSIEVCGLIGDDNNGKSILSYLNNNNISNTFIIKSSKYPTSHALILSNLLDKTRTSFVKWSACTRLKDVKIPKSDWTHIAYLDNLLNLTEKDFNLLRSNSKILSADLCLNQPNINQIDYVISKLPLLDYLIISDSEAQALFIGEKDLGSICRNLGKLVKQGCIIHSPEQVLCYDIVNGFIREPVTKVETNINVLGAGDYWASLYIYNCMNNPEKLSMQNILTKTNTLTAKFLCKKNTTY